VERSRLKKRLVGATVLLSLAVILLPLLVDYQREPEQRHVPVAVPSVPAYRDYPSRVVPIEIPEEVAEKIEQGVVSRRLAAAAAQPDPAEKLEDGREEDGSEKVGPDQSTIGPGEESSSEADIKSELDEGAALKKGWVVQVGTFKNPDSAKRLAAKLKALGFVVYIEPLQLSTGLMSRVRIGPQLLREEAQQQQAQLQEKTDFNGAVLSFP